MNVNTTTDKEPVQQTAHAKGGGTVVVKDGMNVNAGGAKGKGARSRP
jgi:hypothetical protein